MSTEKLYYSDPYLKSFEAKILKIGVENGENYIVLDQTAFYPEGGGQPWDTGKIKGENFEVEVYKVLEVGGEIRHYVKSVEDFSEGATVLGEINWERRILHMQHHTASHIVWGAIIRVVGDVKVAGSGIHADRARIEVFVGKGRKISHEQLEEIEWLANKVIWEDRKVKTYFLPFEEALRKFPELEVKKAVKEVRVVEIEDWDVNFCGGTHVARTGEVLAIRILRRERAGEGVDRLMITAGKTAIDMFWKERLDVENIRKMLNEKNVLKAVQNLLDSKNKLEEKVMSLEAEIQIEKLLGKAEQHGDLKILVTCVDIPKKSMEAVAKRAVQKYPNLVVLIGRVNGGAAVIGAAGEKAIDKGINIGDIINKVSKILGGGGGGQLNFAKGGGPRGDMLEEALENGKKLILEKIS